MPFFGSKHSKSNNTNDDPKNDNAKEDTSGINSRIDLQANPFPDQHNEGQPLTQNLDHNGKQRSKFVTDCSDQHAASLRCIEDNYTKKEVCQTFFEAYRECRREERKRRLAQNSKRSFF